MAVPLYYCFLSLYSYVAVKYDFDTAQYGWMEKWIHLGVHVYPMGSAIYLLTVQAFNPTGAYLCWISGDPVGCGGDSGVECERGPPNIDLLAWIFAALPAFFFLLFPTAVMLALYIHVRQRQQRQQQRSRRREGAGSNDPSSTTLWNSRRVAWQASWYLLGIYWTYIFAMISNGIKWWGGRQVFVLEVLSLVMVNLRGVWILWVYRYFGVVLPRTFPVIIVVPLSKKAKTTQSSSSSNKDDDAPVEVAKVDTGNSKKEEIEHKESTETTKRGGDSWYNNNTRRRSSNYAGRRRSSAGNAPGFNIFDGTHASGPFAQYIFDGDSDDEAVDQEQTDHWNEVQAHV